MFYDNAPFSLRTTSCRLKARDFRSQRETIKKAATGRLVRRPGAALSNVCHPGCPGALRHRHQEKQRPVQRSIRLPAVRGKANQAAQHGRRLHVRRSGCHRPFFLNRIIISRKSSWMAKYQGTIALQSEKIFTKSLLFC